MRKSLADAHDRIKNLEKIRKKQEDIIKHKGADHNPVDPDACSQENFDLRNEIENLNVQLKNLQQELGECNGRKIPQVEVELSRCLADHRLKMAVMETEIHSLKLQVEYFRGKFEKAG